jgi:hypothetical protein
MNNFTFFSMSQRRRKNLSGIVLFLVFMSDTVAIVCYDTVPQAGRFPLLLLALIITCGGFAYTSR